MAAAKRLAEPTGISIPESPEAMISRDPESMSHAIGTQPIAMASMVTIPKGSFLLVIMKMSEADASS
jgi:hypothetical protein